MESCRRRYAKPNAALLAGAIICVIAAGTTPAVGDGQKMDGKSKPVRSLRHYLTGNGFCQVADLQPVWEMELKEGASNIITNRFVDDPVYLGKFPISSFIIEKVDFDARDEYGAVKPGLLESPVFFDRNGKISEKLSFFPAHALSRRADNGTYYVLGRSNIDAGLTKIGSKVTRTEIPADLANENLVSWTVDDEHRISIVRGDSRSYFVNPRNSEIVSEFQMPLCDVVFAKSADRLAAFMPLSPDGDRSLDNELKAPVVFDFVGNVLYEGRMRHDYKTAIYMFRSGDLILYGVEESTGDPRTICENVETGDLYDTGINFSGIRYHSADGRYVLVEKGWKQGVAYYDLTDPKHVKRVWDWSSGGVTISAAVSSNGEFVAVQQTGPAGDRRRGVFLLDTNGDLVGFGRGDRRLMGLEFHGLFLLEGVQSYPHPNNVRGSTTLGARLFDLSPFSGGAQ